MDNCDYMVGHYSSYKSNRGGKVKKNSEYTGPQLIIEQKYFEKP